MDDKLNIVIINADADLIKLFKTNLDDISSNVNIKGETRELSAGYDLIKKVKPNIAILSLSPSENNALNLAEKITQNFPDTILIMTAQKPKPELIIRAMRAGAKEFLMQPIKKDELVSAVKSVIQLEEQKPGAEISNGKIISVLGVKGGVGTTTIATNIAAVLAKHPQKDVILVDLNLQFSNSALFFNIKPKYSILDVQNNLEGIDPHLLKNTLPKDSSGVCLLTGPSQIEEAESIKSNHIEQILVLLKSIFDFIIIDTNSIIDEITIKALDEADTILTVSTLDIPAVNNTKRFLDLFQRMGYSQEKVSLIFNRYTSADEALNSAMEKSIDYPIFWRIPNQNFSDVNNSINQGVPISIKMPRAKMSLNFIDMAKHLNGNLTSIESEKKENGKANLFQRLLRPKGKKDGITKTVAK